MLKITELPNDAREYRKSVTVLAFYNADAVTYHKSWGDQEMKGGHMTIIGLGESGPDIYGCAISRFEYDPTDKPNEYRKRETVWAKQMSESFMLDTIVDGEVEVDGARGNAGDYILKQHGGELQVVPRGDFEGMFELI